MKSLEDPDIQVDTKGKHKSGCLVLEMQTQHMNLTGRMAHNFRFADDEVTIQFYADAVRQLRMTEVSAAPKSEDVLQRIIKAQSDRVHPYPHLLDSLRLARLTGRIRSGDWTMLALRCTSTVTIWLG